MKGEHFMEKTIKIEGMGCMNCVKHVSAALEKVEGVNKVNVSLDDGMAKVEGNDLNDQALANAVKEAGYTPVSVR